MAEAGDSPTAPVGWSPVRTGFALLVVAWLVWSVALARGAWINSQFVGPRDDVSDSLRRAAYIAERMLPFECAVLVVDAAAAIALLQANRLGWRGVVVWALWVPSAAVHGLAFLVHLIVAG